MQRWCGRCRGIYSPLVSTLSTSPPSLPFDERWEAYIGGVGTHLVVSRASCSHGCVQPLGVLETTPWTWCIHGSLLIWAQFFVATIATRTWCPWKNGNFDMYQILHSWLQKSTLDWRGGVGGANLVWNKGSEWKVKGHQIIPHAKIVVEGKGVHIDPWWALYLHLPKACLLMKGRRPRQVVWGPIL